MDGVTSQYMDSISRELMRKVWAVGDGYKQDISRKIQKAYSWQQKIRH